YNGGIKAVSATHPKETRSQAVISEDLDSHTQNIQATVERAPMAANIPHCVWRELDYHTGVAPCDREK
ncbi:hypothetical protein AVEN_176913-1, partial [Araneus ventricosus]